MRSTEATNPTSTIDAAREDRDVGDVERVRPLRMKSVTKPKRALSTRPPSPRR